MGEAGIQDNAEGGWRREQRPGHKDIKNLLEEFDFMLRATVFFNNLILFLYLNLILN